MQEIKGYYDGESSVIVNKADLEKLGAKPYQVVSVTLQDAYIERKHDEAEKERRRQAIERYGGSCKGLYAGIDPVEYIRKLREDREIVL